MSKQLIKSDVGNLKEGEKLIFIRGEQYYTEKSIVEVERQPYPADICCSVKITEVLEKPENSYLKVGDIKSAVYYELYRI